VIVKNLLGSHNWRGALGAAEDQDRLEEEGRGTQANLELYW